MCGLKKRNKPHNNEHSGSKHGRPSSYINQNKKFVLYYRPLVDKGLILSTEEWFQLRRTISEKLSSVKMSFSHFNPKTGKVVIGFPNQKSMDAATNLLKEVTELWCFESYIPGKMLPKLTLHNVPLDFSITEGTENGAVQRDLVKGIIWKNIIDKNDGVKSLVEQGSTLEIVYFKKHSYTATAAIKVSPNIRQHILEKCNGRLFLFSGTCRASDRCHYLQCFHCLKFGHMQKDCNAANELPICMYCTERHDSRTCQYKETPADHKCINCKSSKTPAISQAFNHCAISRDCPSAVIIMKRIYQNTQFTTNQEGSKNEQQS